MMRTAMSKPLRICIVALNAYPAIEPSAGRAIGGLENRAWNFAVGLARHSHIAVDFVVGHTRPEARTVVEGVTIVPIVDRWRDIRHDVSAVLDPKPSFPWFHVKRWNVKVLWQLALLAMTRPFRDRRQITDRLMTHCDRLRPDVFLSFGVGSQSAAVIRAAKLIRRPVIVALASNSELDARLFEDGDYESRHGETAQESRYAIEHATRVMCQTRWQHDRLLELTGRQSSIVPSPIRIERWSKHPKTERGNSVLWVGRFDQFHKRPELCLDVALRCPDIPFVMVINRGDARLADQVRASAPRNVRIIDYVPADEMPTLFREARVFLSTSAAAFEGFPNVFLEAAASGTPVVTLEDFGDFVVSSGCGECSNGDLNLAIEKLQLLWSHEARWRECSRRGQDWVQRVHALDHVVIQFLNAMEDVLALD